MSKWGLLIVDRVLKTDAVVKAIFKSVSRNIDILNEYGVTILKQSKILQQSN